MAQPSVRERFNHWRDLMSEVKKAVGCLDAQRPDYYEQRRRITSALQMLDTVAGDLIDESLAELMLSTAKLEEAAVLLSARAAGQALADTPMVFASESEVGEILSFAPRSDGLPPHPGSFGSDVYLPEADRGFLTDMARPDPTNVVIFPGVRQSRGGAE